MIFKLLIAIVTFGNVLFGFTDRWRVLYTNYGCVMALLYIESFINNTCHYHVKVKCYILIGIQTCLLPYPTLKHTRGQMSCLHKLSVRKIVGERKSVLPTYRNILEHVTGNTYVIMAGVKFTSMPSKVEYTKTLTQRVVLYDRSRIPGDCLGRPKWQLDPASVVLGR